MTNVASKVDFQIILDLLVQNLLGCYMLTNFFSESAVIEPPGGHFSEYISVEHSITIWILTLKAW